MPMCQWCVGGMWGHAEIGTICGKGCAGSTAIFVTTDNAFLALTN